MVLVTSAVLAATACTDPVYTYRPAAYVRPFMESYVTTSPGDTIIDTVYYQVVDSAGDQLPNQTISLTASSGTLSNQTIVTSTRSIAGLYRASIVVWKVPVPNAAVEGSTLATLTAKVKGLPESEHSIIANFGQLVPTIVSGNDQTGRVSTTLPTPLTIRVTDLKGKPLVGLPVKWGTEYGSLSTTPVPGTSTLNTTTSADGTARAYLTLGAAAGRGTVSVVSGIGDGNRNLPAALTTFTVTATP